MQCKNDLITVFPNLLTQVCAKSARLFFVYINTIGMPSLVFKMEVLGSSYLNTEGYVCQGVAPRLLLLLAPVDLLPREAYSFS